MWEGPRESCGPTSAGGSSFKSLIWFKSISKFVLGGIRIGMGYMNLVTVISIIMYVGMHIINAPELSMQSNTYVQRLPYNQITFQQCTVWSQT